MIWKVVLAIVVIVWLNWLSYRVDKLEENEARKDERENY